MKKKTKLHFHFSLYLLTHKINCAFISIKLYDKQNYKKLHYILLCCIQAF